MSVLFGNGGATSTYLLLYLVTWIAHLVLAGAVVGGAIAVAVAALRKGRPASRWRQAAALLRRELPLLLGLAITAGVAPLLFVQILYREAFYTANLLMHVRFLAILPALLVCFYLLYLGKTERGRRFAGLIYSVAALAALFVGYSFSELHSLAIEPQLWLSKYESKELVHADIAVVARHLAFLGIAGACTALVAAWVGRWRRDSSASSLAPIAIAGIAVAVIGAALAGRSLGPINGPPVAHLIGGVVAAIAAAVAWGVIAARREAAGWPLFAATASTLGFLWCLAIAREVIRAERLDLSSLAARHSSTAEHGGAWLFAAFLLINGCGVAWCITRAWRARRETPSARETQ